MHPADTSRKDLDNQQYLKLRQATDNIAEFLDKRLKRQLNVLRSLFFPKKLLGTYIRSATKEEVTGADRAFAELQKEYLAICEKPFDLPKKLQPPLPVFQNHLEATAFHYFIHCEGSQDRPTKIISPTQWILSYRSECSLNRLRAMLDSREAKQPDDMKQGLIDHLAVVIFLKHFPALSELFEDLRYRVEIKKMEELGGLPVVTLSLPLKTFLPPNDFILQITQLSGIPAFQELIDLEELDHIPDSLKESLQNFAS